mmetsp:Transcript_43041/g.139662  ORF Transcript_43041/g.139662 Transcript_43041/m.139662 type:complete len:224 (+) Transcript_43041:665-1336(+)
MMFQSIHEKPRQTKMLKMFEPSTFAMAMSPSPLRATMMEESESGTEVPEESTMVPITMPGMLRMQPTRVVKMSTHVMSTQIQATDMPKFHMNQYLHLSRSPSGIDSLKTKVSGHAKTFWILERHLYADVLFLKNAYDLEVRSWKERVRMNEGLALPDGETAGAAEAAEDLSAPSAFGSNAVGVKPTPPSLGLGSPASASPSSLACCLASFSSASLARRSTSAM